MAKQLKEITVEIKDEEHLFDTLVKLSIEGGAWVFSIKPFTHTTTFTKFQNPSSVPDHYHDLTSGTMAYKGKLRGFTKAAKIREQNRGLGRS